MIRNSSFGVHDALNQAMDSRFRGNDGYVGNDGRRESDVFRSNDVIPAEAGIHYDQRIPKLEPEDTPAAQRRPLRGGGHSDAGSGARCAVDGGGTRAIRSMFVVPETPKGIPAMMTSRSPAFANPSVTAVRHA